MGMQKQGKSHKLARSSRNRHKSERQWYRTAHNKLKRVNYQRKLAKLDPLRGLTCNGPKGTKIYVTT